MSRRDPKIIFMQMLDSATEAHELSGILNSREEFIEDRLRYLAIARLLEITGEAATRMPSDIRGGYPQIPWQKIIGLRNVLIHAYDTVDLNILWDTITTNLEPLIEALKTAIAELED